MNTRRKITPEQQAELIALYHEHGQAASAAKAVEYGVSPKYASSIAASLGLGRPLWRKGNRYKDQPRRAVRSLNDPRWAKAIANGPVVI